MRVIYYTASSLDGYLADPDNSLAWLFAQEFTEPETPELRIDAMTARSDAVVMGSTTYQWLVENLGSDEWPYPQPAWVLTSRTLESLPGADVRFAAGAVREVMAEIDQNLQQSDATIWLLGGGEVVGQFADAGLLDEVVVSFAPVTWGAGAPLLPRRLQLRLRASEVTKDFVCAHYDVVGLRSASSWNPPAD